MFISEVPNNMISWIYFVALILLFTTIYLYWIFSYWQRKGLEYLKPNLFDGMGNQFLDAYNLFKKKGLKHGGCFAFMKPIYIPVDLDIIKHIFQIDFQYFPNHESFTNEKVDPLRAHLFNLHDEKWKSLRAKLSPTFSSGTKIEIILSNILDSLYQF